MKIPNAASLAGLVLVGAAFLSACSGGAAGTPGAAAPITSSTTTAAPTTPATAPPTATPTAAEVAAPPRTTTTRTEASTTVASPPAAPARPACTTAALTAAFHRDTVHAPNVVLGSGLRAIACSGGYAQAVTSPSSNGPDPAQVLFRARGAAWTVIAAGTGDLCGSLPVGGRPSDRICGYE